MTVNLMPVPPVDMVMPQAANMAYNLVSYAALAVVFLLMAADARRRKSPLPVLCLLGAAIACLLEPAFDIVCCVWYPTINHTPMFRAFSYGIPYWMLPAYAVYMGGQGYWMLKQFEAGLQPERLWKLFFLFWASNGLLELPGLNLGIYTYYGDQPFRLFGFPLWMAMTNSLTPIVIGAVLHSMRTVLSGWRVVLVVAIVPMLVAGVEAAAGWPIWLALNSGFGLALTYPAAIITLGLSLSTVYLVGLMQSGPQLDGKLARPGVSGGPRLRSASGVSQV